MEGNLLKNYRIKPQREKPVFSRARKLIPAKHKKSPIRKIKLPQKFSAAQYLTIILRGRAGYQIGYNDLISSKPE